MKKFYVYIITNKNNSVIYVGMTNNYRRRIWQHKQKSNKNSFSARYNVNKLVYLEEYQTPHDAIAREKQLKAGARKKFN
jgi:putative endonuclease